MWTNNVKKWRFIIYGSESHSEPNQSSNGEFIAKLNDGRKPLTSFPKRYILYIWMGPYCASTYNSGA